MLNPGFNTTATGSNTYLAQIGVVAGSGTVQGLQTIQYSYHIRNWLTAINGGSLNHSENDLFGYQLDYETDGAYFDGNIRKQTWVTKRDQQVRSYTYRYDLANRLTYATYVGSQNENYRTQGISYDRNGNITHLHRQGLKTTNTYGSIDQLTYTYATNSNKLLSVTDAITDNTDMGDFRDGNTSGNDYTYWPNGSLKKDLNKTMTADIAYNYLELTTQVTTSGGTIQTWYDGAGSKLRKTVNGTTTDYVGEMIWVGNQPYQLVHGEGRVLPDGGSWLLEFNYLDQLGNLRLSFRDSLGSAVSGVYPPPVITQINAYSDFGIPLKGLDYASSSQSNKFTFNGKELEESIGWHDFGFRHLDRTIGRWTQNDPLADLGHDLSTYVGFFNNPNTFFDPDGRWPDTYLTPGEEWMKKNGLLEESRKTPDLQRGLTQLYAKTPQGANAHYDISYTNGYLNFFEEQTKDFFGVGYDQYWYRKGRMYIGASSSDVAWGGVHGTMDMLGSVPLLGEGFDLINAGLYSSRGMAKEASTSLLYMVAFAEVLKYFKYIEWPKQLHHFASNKSKTYTQQFENIAS